VTAGATEHGAALLNDAADRPRVQRREAPFDQADIALPDTKHVPPAIERTARHGANGGVHARRIAT